MAPEKFEYGSFTYFTLRLKKVSRCATNWSLCLRTSHMRFAFRAGIADVRFSYIAEGGGMLRRSVAVVLISCATCASAQVYRCQTPNGVVYADQPCGKDARMLKQAPSATMEESKAARDAAERDRQQALRLDQENEAKRKTQDAVQKRAPGVTSEQLARACVDRYRPHLAYPEGVRILGSELVKDGFGTTIYVTVRTITNNSTPIAIDPITLSERFICRLDPATNETSIDNRWTDDYVNKHKKGERL